MGIRFKESLSDTKFMNFFNIVQSAANKLGKIFFFWSDEGNGLVTDELDGGDMSGWLVDEEDAERFDAIWRKSTKDIPDEFAFVIARWHEDRDGSIGIEFE